MQIAAYTVSASDREILFGDPPSPDAPLVLRPGEDTDIIQAVATAIRRGDFVRQDDVEEAYLALGDLVDGLRTGWVADSEDDLIDLLQAAYGRTFEDHVADCAPMSRIWTGRVPLRCGVMRPSVAERLSTCRDPAMSVPAKSIARATARISGNTLLLYGR